jgi:hypothetical protein
MVRKGGENVNALLLWGDVAAHQRITDAKSHNDFVIEINGLVIFVFVSVRVRTSDRYEVAGYTV